MAVHDTEDKEWWVRAGLRRREAFVGIVAPSLGLDATHNPAHEEDKAQAELLVQGLPSDLQCPTTPFFKAEELYGIPLQYAVTWNRVDYQRYLAGIGAFFLIWWVHWDTTQMRIGRRDYSTPRLSGVWRTPYEAIAERIAQHRTPRHTYARRVGDRRGNARDSYVLDLRRFERLSQSDWMGPSPSDFDPAD